jgi:hypothetical protein
VTGSQIYGIALCNAMVDVYHSRKPHFASRTC